MLAMNSRYCRLLVVAGALICSVWAQPVPEEPDSPTLVRQAGAGIALLRLGFGPDNAWLAVADNSRIRIYDVASGRVSRVMATGSAKSLYGYPVLALRPG